MSERPLLDPTPSALGYRMPPEWAPHEATWLTWPHQRETWPGCFERIPDVFAAMAQALVPTEEVRIVAHDEAVELAAREALAVRKVDPSRVRFFRIPNDDAWVRDHGPTFV
ncbi:MAG: agmatine deiminase family protein, partial [Planctomycetota bacterium]